MKKMGFRCELLSDLVLPVSAATEGHSTALAYIPGAKFSGIVARHYDEYSAKQKSYDIFHSGKIRFTDAHPLGEENEHTWKIPFAWYVQKGAEIKKGNTIIKENIFIFTGPGKERQMEKQGKQYRQICRGFISRNGEFVQNETRFSLKSAYNPEVRRAREGQLFGYEALNKGRKWFFSVCADDDVDEETLEGIKNHLAGTHSIGRSRTAQYGRVEIIPVDSLKETECFSPQEDYCYLYAGSNLCFYDNYGEPVLTPDIGSLGFEKNEDATIVWELSHIRPFIYAPWNNKRYQRDRDRVCIAKGSVITLKLLKPGEFDITVYQDRLSRGIGAYTSEGLGQVLVNPWFLKPDNNGHPDITIRTGAKTGKAGIKIPPVDTNNRIVMWLDKKIKDKQTEELIVQKVREILDKKGTFYDPITTSQWGMVHQAAQSAKDYNALMGILFDDKKGVFETGSSKKTWKIYKKEFRETIESMKDKNPVQFTMILCLEMAKRVAHNKRTGQENGS